MHIIFGKEQAKQLSDKYTVLELDSFQLEPDGVVITSYCAVEKIPFQEISLLPYFKETHKKLLIDYQNRNWDNCLLLIEDLIGKWGGELDSFYEDLSLRINSFIKKPPSANWSPVIFKQSS